MNKLKNIDDTLEFIVKTWYDGKINTSNKEELEIPRHIPPELKKILHYINCKNPFSDNPHSTIFDNQDALKFEVKDNLIYFIIENQGNWQVAYDIHEKRIAHTAGYLSNSDKKIDELTYVDFSLVTCLMTFALFEVVMGAKEQFIHHATDFLEKFKGDYYTLLEKGSYVWDSDNFNFYYFYNAKIMIMEGRDDLWIASNELTVDEIQKVLEL